jgi:anti-sigma regulatory factor (Ser/Thr protein kinase)
MTSLGGAADVHEDVWIAVDESAAVHGARRRAATLATAAGFGADRVSEVEIVASELATNVVKHGGGGDIVLRRLTEADGGGLQLVAIDAGPGTRHLQAMVGDGRTTAGTLGLGLGAIHRLSTRVDMWSAPTRGAVVVARLVADGTDREPAVAQLRRTIRGESVCGDNVGHRVVAGGTLLMVADGLGHGPLAARASSRALDVLHGSDTTSPADLVQRMHRALSGTRGAAIAIVLVDSAARTLVHAGVGNISCRLVGGQRARSLPSQPGIVGHNLPRVREHSFDLDDSQLVILHSDGLTEKWSADDLPPVTEHGAMVVAATLLRDAGTRRDDASVLAMRVSV